MNTAGAVGVIGLLLIAMGTYGYLAPRLFPKRYYSVMNLSFALVAVLLGYVLGMTREELGLLFSFANVLWSALLFLLSWLCIWVRSQKRRTRLDEADFHELLFRIPFATALAEEILFRGLLFGLLLHSFGSVTAILVSSLVFGVWHLLPEAEAVWANENLPFKQVHPIVARVSSWGVTILVTSLGGVLFGSLRVISGSILLPWACHSAINMVSWTVSRTQYESKR